MTNGMNDIPSQAFLVLYVSIPYSW